jgi:hypothetical protein
MMFGTDDDFGIAGKRLNLEGWVGRWEDGRRKTSE